MIELSSGIKKACLIATTIATGDVIFKIRHCATNSKYELSYSEYEQNEHYLCVDFGDFNGQHIPFGEYEYELYYGDTYISCGLMKYYDDYIIHYCQDRTYYEYGG